MFVYRRQIRPEVTHDTWPHLTYPRLLYLQLAACTIHGGHAALQLCFCRDSVLSLGPFCDSYEASKRELDPSGGKEADVTQRHFVTGRIHRLHEETCDGHRRV